MPGYNSIVREPNFDRQRVWQYATVTHADKQGFADECTKFMQEGWEPVGGLAIAVVTHTPKGKATTDLVYSQAFKRSDYK